MRIDTLFSIPLLLAAGVNASPRKADIIITANLLQRKEKQS
jgi:hypothetical protein